MFNHSTATQQTGRFKLSFIYIYFLLLDEENDDERIHGLDRQRNAAVKNKITGKLGIWHI